MAVYTEPLKKVRKQRGLTQKDVSELLGLSPITYALYENGNRQLSWQMLNQLADILKTSTDYLLGRTDETVPYEKPKEE